MDQYILDAVRKNVDKTLQHARERIAEAKHVLDVGPERRVLNWPGALVETLDIQEGCTHRFDLCLPMVPYTLSNRYDVIICTEVLEHTLDPFKAMNSLRHMLKMNGTLFVTVPFALGPHAPEPDCWRFTVDGLRTLSNHAGLTVIDIWAAWCDEPGYTHGAPAAYGMEACKSDR